MNEKADPFNHKQRWQQWKQDMKVSTRFCGNNISYINRKLILEYLLDMESGYNVARKGKMSYIRLNTLRQRIIWIIDNIAMEDITKITRRELLAFFNKMVLGEIKRHDGGKYRSVTDYIKVFKAFWHWFQKHELENDRIIKDITVDLSVEAGENEFVYFTIDELKAVINHCKFEYRTYMWFLFDSGIRAPTEFMSLKVRDFHWLDNNSLYELDIKDSYAKTFGRKIKLILSSQILKEFLANRNPDEPFFTIDWKAFCQYIKRAFIKILGDKSTKGGKGIKEIRPYDFRHSAACYWRTHYKNINSYMYRFGWKEMAMVNYYTKFLGMQDTISHDDLIVDSEAKSKLERELEQERKTRALMEERMVAQEKQFNDMNAKFEQINTFMNHLFERDPSLAKSLAEKAKANNITVK
ncbi:MAG: Phage integrase family protein [Planctomycetes bacterium ADurb.Bin401]|nr:MAG: Phage integrase family protein [Planctomycetes bacterium ADurb.Bin401]